MAELYQAYGSFNDEEEYDEKPSTQQAPVYNPNVPQLQQKQQSPQQSQQPQQLQQPQQKVVQNTRENFTQEYLSVPVQQSQQQYQYKKNTSYSFWDRMSMKRSEVIKLAIFALVIVLAIALDRIGTHYLTKYISDNIFTEFQEFMLRLSYPVVIFIILWIVKAL